MNESEKFIKIRDKFSIGFGEIQSKIEKTAWDFYINSTTETMKSYEFAQNELTELFCTPKAYDKFLKIDKNKLTIHEQKQLKNLLRCFDERLNSKESFQILEKKENEIAQKYNSYVPTIDGKEVSKTEISKILQSETDAKLRKKAYEAHINGGNIIAEDLIKLIKLRNKFAQSKGYENYFIYKLKEEFDVDPDFLEKLINQVYTKSKNKIISIQNKKYEELRQIFNTKNLEGWHYGLITTTNPAKAVNEIIQKYDIENISKNAYKKMGYDIDELIKNGNLTLDLFPRKNKNTHGFAFCIKPGTDARILANLRNDILSLDTLNHELGHCIYDLGISKKLPILDQEPASSAFTEAIAMMMGDLHKKENILKDIIPEKILIPFKDSLKEDNAEFIAKSLNIINFEMELYKNPEQDCAKLWASLRIKYRNQPHKPNNEWATIPHYLSHPAYYQNYFRATLMKVQLYNHLYKLFGNITENSLTAKYLNEKIFSKGSSINEYDLIKEITGNCFSADDFINSL